MLNPLYLRYLCIYDSHVRALGHDCRGCGWRTLEFKAARGTCNHYGSSRGRRRADSQTRNKGQLFFRLEELVVLSDYGRAAQRDRENTGGPKLQQPCACAYISESLAHKTTPSATGNDWIRKRKIYHRPRAKMNLSCFTLLLQNTAS